MLFYSRFEKQSLNPRRVHKGFYLHHWTEDIPKDRYRWFTGPIHLRSGNVGLAKKVDSEIRQMTRNFIFVLIELQAYSAFLM